MLRGSRIAAAVIAGVILGALAVRSGWAAAPNPSAKAETSEKLDFLIYDPTNTKLIGRGSYTVAMSEDAITISGRNDYLDGSYDTEHEELMPHGDKPRLLSYKHSFFRKNGSRQIIATADPVTGKASCATFRGAQRDVRSEVLQFPADTYAGASVMVPIADDLKHYSSGDIHFHAFDCAPGPRIFKMEVSVQRALWGQLPSEGDLLKADALPVFGWYDVFLKPFVPKTQFWFNPRLTFGFMGGTMSRYYEGPEIMLVRVPPTLAVPLLTATPPTAPPPTAALSNAHGPVTPAPAVPMTEAKSRTPGDDSPIK